MFIEKAYAATDNLGWSMQSVGDNVSSAASIMDWVVSMMSFTVSIVVIVLVMRICLTLCLKMIGYQDWFENSFLWSAAAARFADKMELSESDSINDSLDNIVDDVNAFNKDIDNIKTIVDDVTPKKDNIKPSAVASGCPDFELDTAVADIIANVDMSEFDEYKD